ncbi:MAG TPA: discoidin domain-containing protein [Terriglobales bacterium]|nr:discoidin domain-containing protein [Terriglobales bacterium]
MSLTKITILPSPVLIYALFFLPTAASQTVRVDITPSHSTNQFIPTKTLGAGIDRIAVPSFEKGLSEPTLKKVLESGWQTVTYRQNTELLVEAWHWNPEGKWSDAQREEGYFTGASTPTQFIRNSYGYALPHRGFTRNDGTGNAGYSRLTDGDPNSYWKSNPYLTERFTGESDALHPQWVIVELPQDTPVDSMRIAWGEPYAEQYLVQYWTGTDPIKSPTMGSWNTFPQGVVADGKGGTVTIRLTPAPMPVHFVRIWMTKSSNTCDTHGSGDPRNCVGYAIKELYLGTTTADGEFHDVLRHTKDQAQTTTYCSSVDPWHTSADLTTMKQAQLGFDYFYTSGVTRGLPAMVPVALLYDTPENAAAEIAYLEKRHYPISYVEMGEEADGQYMLPEDYGALYLQWAAALHRVDPSLKLGGPSFQGVNSDIQVWPDEEGRVSWTRRFLGYLRKHDGMKELSFFSFEHYPLDPCRIQWSSLYEEPGLVSHIVQVWREDGVPADVPLFITESNLSWATGENYLDNFAGLWLADYIGSFLNAGGKGVYYFHFLPLPMERGCNDTTGTFGMFSVDANGEIEQPLAQFFASKLINTEWVEPGDGVNRVFPAEGDVNDGAGHALVTAYAIERPDGDWSLMVVNHDQDNAHKVHIVFQNENEKKSFSFTGSVARATFGSEQYQWHPAESIFMAHVGHNYDPSVSFVKDGHADPDGPIATSHVQAAGSETWFELPRASVTVLRGKFSSQ